MGIVFHSKNKRKIINDPLYGFVTLPNDLVYDLIENSYFQRLRRIKQLGLTNLVYPGALHTRFHHCIGAMSLMDKALNILEKKGIQINPDEKEGALAAILLHDIGHGPFSHTLENTIIQISHEQISIAFMKRLNQQLGGKLDLAIDIFLNKYHKKFLHQLISSQLDVDRLDYLRRDSFYTGVSEGIISYERIINMLNVHQNELVVEEKGIYSIEKFIIARRLMYWQVYLHKTTVAADEVLKKALKRAKIIIENDGKLPSSSSLNFFLVHDFNKDSLRQDHVLEQFALLDDSDIISALKEWSNCKDPILSNLSSKIINRRLPHILFGKHHFNDSKVNIILDQLKNNGMSDEEINYYTSSGEVENEAYKNAGGEIKILRKDGSIEDLAVASDNYNINALKDAVKKPFFIFPRS
ncbi:MAG: HD domain-containing protein [Bacteroidota bacterium]|nr:HD domain-containing protein [Bacteroidota bacterium]